MNVSFSSSAYQGFSFLFLKVPNFMWGSVVKTSIETGKKDPCLKTGLWNLRWTSNPKLEQSTGFSSQKNWSQTEGNSLEKLNSATRCTVPRAHYVFPRGTPTIQVYLQFGISNWVIFSILMIKHTTKFLFRMNLYVSQANHSIKYVLKAFSGSLHF